MEGRMKLSDFVVREAILVDLKATGKEEAIREIVRSLLDAGKLAEADLEGVARANADPPRARAVARVYDGLRRQCEHPVADRTDDRRKVAVRPAGRTRSPRAACQPPQERRK